MFAPGSHFVPNKLNGLADGPLMYPAVTWDTSSKANNGAKPRNLAYVFIRSTYDVFLGGGSSPTTFDQWFLPVNSSVVEISKNPSCLNVNQMTGTTASPIYPMAHSTFTARTNNGRLTGANGHCAKCGRRVPGSSRSNPRATTGRKLVDGESGTLDRELSRSIL